jgi:hypothetical protein
MNLRVPLECVILALIVNLLAPGGASGHEPGPVRDCSAYSYARPFPPAPADYKPRYHTTAHRFLDDERNVGPVSPSEYAILDAILDEARTRLKPIPPNLNDADYVQFADESMKTIDCTLVRHGFVYPGIGFVGLLSDGLDPTMFNTSKYYDSLLDSPHNLGRTTFIEKRKPGPYYVVDCDIASYIYLAIGEVMKYPLSMVDLPLHNFVRWMRPDDTYIDFETMDGKETNDDYYRIGWCIPQKFVGVPGVLTTMTASQLAAYHDFTVALAISYKHDYPATIAEYRKSISVDPSLSEASNNLAWLYTVVPTPALRDGRQAVVYANRAVAILPSSDNLDTLACAYGLAGDFPQAVASESRAIEIDWAPQKSDLKGDLALLSKGQRCDDPKFGNDPHPFRPNTPTVTGILSKDANAVH